MALLPEWAAKKLLMVKGSVEQAGSSQKGGGEAMSNGRMVTHPLHTLHLFNRTVGAGFEQSEQTEME